MGAGGAEDLREALVKDGFGLSQNIPKGRSYSFSCTR